MDKVYKVGAIGTSWAARIPLPTFQSYRRTEIVAIASARMERAQEAAAKFGADRAFDDYREMVRLPDLDIVYVGGPVHLHHAMVMAALEAGKHVLCEKPLALNVAEAREMVDLAERSGLRHVVAFTMRHYPWAFAIKQLIDDGFLGQVRHANVAWFMGRAATPPAGSAAAARGRNPNQPWSWVNDSGMGGGMMGAMGSHYIDLMRYFIGEYKEVWGATRSWRKEAPVEGGGVKEVTADDGFALQATMAGGAAFSLHLSGAVRPGSGSRLELYGSEGSIVLDGEVLRVAGPGDGELRPYEIEERELPDNIGETALPRFGLMIHKLIQGIEDDGYQVSPNLVDGLRCQEVNDAIKSSQLDGRRVEITGPVGAKTS